MSRVLVTDLVRMSRSHFRNGLPKVEGHLFRPLRQGSLCEPGSSRMLVRLCWLISDL
jgi:hypothetical protein